MVLYYFTGSWCVPCKMLGPLVDKICEELDIKVEKKDVNEEQALAFAYDVTSVPTLILFKDFKVVFSVAGILPEEALRQLLTKAIEQA